MGAAGVCEAVLAGAVPPSLHAELLRAGGAAAAATAVLTAGDSPALGAWAGPEADSGVLAAAAALAVTAVSAVGSAVFSLLSSPWGAKPAPSPAIGTAPSAPPEAALPPALHGAHCGGLEDAPRRGRCLRLAPRGALAAAADSLGRVLLLDLQAGPLCAIRLWKGYRDAQLAWLDGPSEGGVCETPPPLCLAVHAPHRGGLLEVWRMRHGGCVARLRCGPNCRLLAPCPVLGAFGERQRAAAYVLDGAAGELRILDWTA